MAETAMPFVTGGLSAMLASACIHPIDLGKVRVQLYATLHPGKPIPSSYAVLQKMIKVDGISSVYAGLSASLLRQAVYGTARIGLHRTFSDALIKRNGGKPLVRVCVYACACVSLCLCVLYHTNPSPPS